MQRNIHTTIVINVPFFCGFRCAPFRVFASGWPRTNPNLFHSFPSQTQAKEKNKAQAAQAQAALATQSASADQTSAGDATADTNTSVVGAGDGGGDDDSQSLTDQIISAAIKAEPGAEQEAS